MIGNEVHIMMRWKEKEGGQKRITILSFLRFITFNSEFNFSQRFSPHKLQLNVISGYLGGSIGNGVECFRPSHLSLWGLGGT